jgi:stage II sporulation protein P
VTIILRYGRKEVDRLNKKWLFALFVILAVAVMFFFFKWLYTPDTYTGSHRSDMDPSDSNSTDAVEVFNYDIEKRLKLEEYSGNLAIQLINAVITNAKVSYEKDYGCPMPGILASAAGSLTGGLHTDIRNPITYLNIAFTAFSQYDPSTLSFAGNTGNEPNGNTAQPDITNFEDAPEGAIYFSEEDEYTSEGSAHGQKPLTPAGTQVPQIAEETVGLPGKIEIVKNAPQILIYHSHATESYMPNSEGNYHTLNEKNSVIAAGNALTKVLQDKYKYKVIHDKTLHDKQSYAYSYANSLVTIKNNLNKYKSLNVILDLHRDAFEVKTAAEKKASKAEYTVNINNKNAAKIMLVIAKGNPNYAELEKFAVYLKKKMDKLYPGLFFKITVMQRGKYNQYFSNHSMLVEIGCMLNTSEEAQYSAELFGKVLGEVMKDLKE